MVSTTMSTTTSSTTSTSPTAARPWKLSLAKLCALLLSVLVLCLKSDVTTAQLLLTPPTGSDLSPDEARVQFLGQLQELNPKLLRSALAESVRSVLSGLEHEGSSSSDGDTTPGQETPYNTRCLRNIEDILVALEKKEPWALKVIDAMGRPSPAVSEGNFLWPGAYDLCLTIRSNFSLPSPSHPNFSGRYCNAITSLNLLSPENMFYLGGMVLLGLCVPDTCSAVDLTMLLNDVLNRVGSEIQAGVDCPAPIQPLDTMAIITIVVCSILLLLLVLGTVADVIMRFKPDACTDSGQSSTILKVLLAFSVYTNGSKLLSTSQPEGSLTCLHGIRIVGCTWAVLFHSFMYLQLAVTGNVIPHVRSSYNGWFFPFKIQPYMVDIFFVISGLLVAYLTLNELKKKDGKLNWLMFFVRRFYRLTPVYAILILVSIGLMPYVAEGPFLSFGRNRNDCRSSWWTCLLYISNLVKTDKFCIPQSWSTANDMQFYCLLSPLVILSLYHVPVAGYVVVGALVGAQFVINAVLTFNNRYSPAFYMRTEGGVYPNVFSTFLKEFYFPPYTRYGPYVVGMAAGYVLHVTKCKLTIRWYVNAALWSVATAGAFALLYGLCRENFGDPVPLNVAVFFNAVHRTAWGACVAWVIVACVTGNGGIVNTILSWPAFVPLSRLTYGVYMVQLLVFEFYMWNSRQPFFMNDSNLVAFALTVLTMSILAAGVVYLAVEAPMLSLEKFILPSFRSRDVSRDQQKDGQQDSARVKKE